MTYKSGDIVNSIHAIPSGWLFKPQDINDGVRLKVMAIGGSNKTNYVRILSDGLCKADPSELGDTSFILIEYVGQALYTALKEVQDNAMQSM